MSKSPGAGAARDTAEDDDSATLSYSDPHGLPDLARDSTATFTTERDEFVELFSHASNLPQDEEAFVARDPFSAAYAEFLLQKGRNRQRVSPEGAQVDAGLRANLLEKPHLMEKSEEGALRGAGAVWRSLRDELHGHSLGILDTSEPAELIALQRELTARRAVIGSVLNGVDMMLKRVEQRLAETSRDPGDKNPAA